MVCLLFTIEELQLVLHKKHLVHSVNETHSTVKIMPKELSLVQPFGLPASIKQCNPCQHRRKTLYNNDKEEVVNQSTEKGELISCITKTHWIYKDSKSRVGDETKIDKVDGYGSN